MKEAGKGGAEESIEAGWPNTDDPKTGDGLGRLRRAAGVEGPNGWMRGPGDEGPKPGGWDGFSNKKGPGVEEPNPGVGDDGLKMGAGVEGPKPEGGKEGPNKGAGVDGPNVRAPKACGGGGPPDENSRGPRGEKELVGNGGVGSVLEAWLNTSGSGEGWTTRGGGLGGEWTWGVGDAR